MNILEMLSELTKELDPAWWCGAFVLGLYADEKEKLIKIVEKYVDNERRRDND